MPNYKIEATEAMCSALYQMPFTEFLGEADITETREHQHWFHLGEKPKDIRVTVSRPLSDDDHFVTLRIEWRNYHADPRNPLLGRQDLRINTHDVSSADLQGPTTRAVLRVLEVLQDVREETGVAGEISKLAPAVEESDEAEE